MGRLSIVAAASLYLCGCAVSPLARRTSAFAIAATLTVTDTSNAYETVENTYRDAQLARLVANYDDAGFDATKLKPFLSEQDRKVRDDVLKGLRSYAELLTSISGDQPLTDIDSGAKSLAQSLQGISAANLATAKLTSTNANIAATAINALGAALVDRRRRRDLPGILHQMQQPVQTICDLLEQDIGDPERSGLRNQLHNSYLDLIREQKNYIAANQGKLSPAEKRQEIRVLPGLVTSEADADRALAETQKGLTQLALTHTALAQTAGQKDAPAFRLEIQQLAAGAQRLDKFYASLPSHP